MSTPNPSTTPKPTPDRKAHPGAQFARAHGPAARWTSDAGDQYFDLFSAPSFRRTSGAAR
ncbi:hypothetical protein [Streptomyces sp. NPDC127114]|uniref:hypothetical protein n=1 Tax=Streptomyces sp. NPDC127114 TaxID=3345366 RepID=UPI00362AA9C9